MTTVNNLLKRWKGLDLVMTSADAVNETSDSLVELNREQLMEGKRSDGADITPSYLDDPYFKSKESAQRYSDWKDEITPNKKRKKGTPNLFIVGTFHKSIGAKASGEDITYESYFSEANDIERKFAKIYGLNPESKKKYIPVLKPVFMALIRRFLNR